MRLVYFTHSLRSCWNHGNAHFLRGVLRELIARGTRSRRYEPSASVEPPKPRWRITARPVSRRTAKPIRSCARAPTRTFWSSTCPCPMPTWSSSTNGTSRGWWRLSDASAAAAPASRSCSTTPIIAPSAIPRRSGASTSTATTASSPSARRWPRSTGAGAGAGASSSGTRPPTRASSTRRSGETERQGLVWIGNWGDDERSAELETFLLRPAQAVGLPLDIYGVRYPDGALQALARHGARYRGWLPNARAPEVFARHLATVHVPRRFYVDHLPGIPTIRVFEALACGIPLVSRAVAGCGEPVPAGRRLSRRQRWAGDGARISAPCATIPACAAASPRAGSRRSARGTPARIAPRSFSASPPRSARPLRWR